METCRSPAVQGLFSLRQVRCGGLGRFPLALPPQSGGVNGGPSARTHTTVLWRLPETSPKAWSATSPCPHHRLVEEGQCTVERQREKLCKINPRFILRCCNSCQKLMGVCRRDPAPADAKAFRCVPCEGAAAATAKKSGDG